MRLGKFHPIIPKYRLMKEFGWSINELAELDSKTAEELLFVIKSVDAMVKEQVEEANRRTRQ